MVFLNVLILIFQFLKFFPNEIEILRIFLYDLNSLFNEFENILVKLLCLYVSCLRKYLKKTMYFINMVMI